MTNLIPVSQREVTTLVTNADGSVGQIHVVSIQVMPMWFLFLVAVVLLVGVLSVFGWGAGRRRRLDSEDERGSG